MPRFDDPQLPRTTWAQPADTAPSGKGKLIATLGTTAAAIALALVQPWEGKSNDPYKDTIAGDLLTVCYGETNVAMHHYSDAECSDMLASSLSTYGTAVLKRNPELRDHPYQLAAASSLAYNIGPLNYSKSTVAKRFSAGNWRGACDAFLMWDRAGGKVIRGLLNRRNAERKVCLKGVS